MASLTTTHWASRSLWLLAFAAPCFSVLSRVILGTLFPLAALAALPFAIQTLREKSVRLPFTLIGIATLYLLFSALRSPAPEYRAWFFLGFGLLEITSFAILLFSVFRLPPSALKLILPALAFGVYSAGCLLMLEWIDNQPLTGFLAFLDGTTKPMLFKLDRAIVIASLLLWALVALALKRGLSLWLCFAALVPVALLISGTSSQASLLGLSVGMIVMTLCKSYPRHAPLVLRYALYLMIVMMPLVVSILGHILATPFFQINFLADANASGRLGIWTSMTIRIFDAPIFGHGIEAGFVSALMPHPHNGILQLWLEFGAFGIALFALLLGWICKKIEQVERAVRPALYAALSAWLVVMSVSYGLWQAWWLATGLLLTLLCVIAVKLPSAK